MDEMDALSSSSKQSTAEQEQQRRPRALSQLARSQVAEEPTPRRSPSAPRMPAKRRADAGGRQGQFGGSTDTSALPYTPTFRRDCSLTI